MFRRSVALLTLVAFLFSPLRGLSAEQVEHLVTTAELESRLTAAEQQRQDDIRTLQGFLRRHESRELLDHAGMDPEFIRQAVPGLDHEALAHLARQSRELDGDVTAAGYPGGRYFGLYLLAALLILAVLWGTVIADGGPA